MLQLKKRLTKEEQKELYFNSIAPKLEQGLTQFEIAEELGYSKSQIARAIYSVSDVNKMLISRGIDPQQFHSGWIKEEGYSLYVQNKTDNTETKESFIKEAKEYAPKYPVIKRNKIEEGHMLIIDPADVHIGRLGVNSETGETYNSQEAVNRVKKGVQDLLSKVSVPLDKIVLVIGNDILNFDNTSVTTTKGTRQDSDVMWHEALTMARKLYVELVEHLVTIADVHIIYNISNHDIVMGFGLAEAVYCWFNNNKNVTFDITPKHRKYFQYGENMICTSHGDGAPENKVPHLAASEEPMMWATTKHRYAYLHHIHHYKKMYVKGGEDGTGFTIEYLRSPSSPDRWSYVNGYISKPAIEGFIHSKKNGQIIKLIAHL